MSQMQQGSLPHKKKSNTIFAWILIDLPPVIVAIIWHDLIEELEAA
jgi:hypothetical protein